MKGEYVKLRPGRLSNDERLMILNKLGEMAQKMYKDNIDQNSQGYNLTLIREGLKYIPYPAQFWNYYFIDNGSEELDKIAMYFEYGTGLYSTVTADRDFIKPKNYKYMSFIGTKNYANMFIFTKKVKGVRPIMMYQKTMWNLETNKDYLQRLARMELGI